ncbi:hypothetical protein C8Q70DRAFT_1049865 [Cubamyces menziesii]|uniref:Uncharacterized protein n=1 Tax=Trametes cubensis TaxID=1111947 RepID=A0AAD7TPC2_9APHY|nr:hypothetical protein C8Q70DRAFT_1049865 [Cubamyces menziesii]KAJ8473455.1 hypothetical protein ONZ51_g7858 [Trametes cubensis]
MPSSSGPYGRFLPPLHKMLQKLPPQPGCDFGTYKAELAQPLVRGVPAKAPPKHQQTTTEQCAPVRVPPAAPVKDESTQSQRMPMVKNFSHPHQPCLPTLVSKVATAAPLPWVRQQEGRFATQAASAPSPVLSPISPELRALPTHAVRVDHRPSTLPDPTYRRIRPEVLCKSQRLLGIAPDDLASSDMWLLEQARLLFPPALPPRAIPSLSSVTRPSFATSYASDGRPLACLPIPLVSGPQASSKPVSVLAPAHPSLVARQERTRHRNYNGPINRQSRPLDSVLARRHGALEDSTPCLSREARHRPSHPVRCASKYPPGNGTCTTPGPVYTSPGAAVYARQTSARVPWYSFPDVNDDARTPSWASLSPCSADTPLQVSAFLGPAATPPSGSSPRHFQQWPYDDAGRYAPVASPYFTGSSVSSVLSSPASFQSDLECGGFEMTTARLEVGVAVPQGATTMSPSVPSPYSQDSTALSPFNGVSFEHGLGNEDISDADAPIDNSVVISPAPQLHSPLNSCGVQNLGGNLEPEQLGALQQRWIPSEDAPQPEAKVQSENSDGGSQCISSYSSLSGALGPTWSS